MTDERMGAALWSALRALPRGSGVIVRHDTLDRAARLRLALKVGSIAKRRGLVLGVAGDVGLARLIGAELVHRPAGACGLMPRSFPVHDESEARLARRISADLVLVSPIFPTSSHPDGQALGSAEAKRLARIAGTTAIALGGMNEWRWHALGRPFHGYAGIDCWIRT
ncbi:thiamine phosphate synthase [Sphingomonas jaspsi]|uniref:thiamine phosphate synthase n=1 Tax=Sphingomonas jaspsi TaxID=392409 RepID=UPI000683E2B2|nr:thiamine phosphate synthase [Sphingomonas jaspsi]